MNIRKELHATELVGGRGNLGPSVVTKFRRSQILREALQVTADLPGVSIINVCCAKSRESVAFERLLNRINTAMNKIDSHAIVVSDRGKEKEYTRLARKMSVFNPIPSRIGAWESGSATKNIPLDRIVDDLIFKDSKSSHFVQLADLCAYSLLRKENPIESKNRYGIHKAFEILIPVLNKQASRSDPLGIVRG